MKDGLALGWFKWLVVLSWRVELLVWRALVRLRRRPLWALSGSCTGCGACCVEPSILVGFFTWHFPTLRRLFLAWQRRVNGFQLASAERGTRTFVFRCTHYDPASRRCDSYATRPAMCRDYPRVLLQDAWPELFEGCGFRVVSCNRKLRAQIDATSLPEEEKAALKRKLRLD